MKRLTELPTLRVLKALQRADWQVSGGSKHYKLIHLSKPGILVVPRSTPLKKGTLAAIIRQAGLTLDEFWQLYR